MDILQPMVVLALWTMVMWVWMYATRIPAMQAAKVDPDALANDPELYLDRILPPKVQWKSHNYNHLHEAPTLFYAIAITLVLLGRGDGLSAWLGWAYVVLRIAHSLVQVTANRVLLRFAIFAASTLVLFALIGIAAVNIFIS